MHYMRQNSGTGAASGDTVTIGPCLDSAGAEYTGLVIGDLTITKNGTSAAMAANATLTHTSNGFYDLVMIGNNADTLGKITIRCNKSTYQIPPAKYVVLTATAYDALVANGTIASTTSGRTITVSAGGKADANLAEILGTAITGTAAQLAAAFTKFFNVATPTGTVNSLPDAPPGTGSGVATATNVSAVETDTQDIQTSVATILSRMGTPSNLGGGATFAANLSDIEAQTDDIGTAGAGLTAIPWNAAWDAEVQSEVDDALVARNLHTTEQRLRGLVIAQGTIGSTGNSTTAVHLTGLTYGDDEIADYVLVIFDVSESEYHTRTIVTWANTGDLATVAALPFTPQNATDTYWLLPKPAVTLDDIESAISDGTITAGEVWSSSPRTLTAIDEDSTTLDLDATIRAAIGMTTANLDTQLAAIDDLLDTELPALTTDVSTVLSRIGTPSNLGGGATLSANLSDIEGQTDDIGVAGLGLSAIPWNAAWDAEVQSEVVDGLGTALTESYRAHGATGSVAQILYELLAHHGNSSNSGTTKTLKNLAGIAVKTYTYDSAGTPTSIAMAS